MTDDEVKALLTENKFVVEGSFNHTINRLAYALLEARAENARLTAAQESVATLQRMHTDRCRDLAAAQAQIEALQSLEGAADRVLRFITNPDWADQNSEVFRTTPWQRLYDEMRKDRDDFPALVRMYLEAFACADFRDELRAALPAKEGE